MLLYQHEQNKIIEVKQFMETKNLYFIHNKRQQKMLEDCTLAEATERVQKYVDKNNPTFKIKTYDNCGDKHFDIGFFHKYFIWKD